MNAVAVALPVNIPWNTEVTVVGLLVVLILMISFGVLVPRPYVKRQEQLHDHEIETNKRNTEALEELAQATAKITGIGEGIEKIMTTLQQDAGDRR